MKNRILLENDVLPGDLRQQIDAFADHYNHQRCDERRQNFKLTDVYLGRGHAVLKQRPSD